MTGKTKAKTPAERKAAQRARLAQKGLAEVRGIFAHPDDHAKIKAAAARVKKRRAAELGGE